MAKETFKPGTMIYPLPAVLVSCGGSPEDYNLMTAAWTGTLCTDPPMCYVSIRPERHSYGLIKKYGEVVLNLTTEELAKATDWCGVKSGRDTDKWAAMGLHPLPGHAVKAPIVVESPLSIECRVVQILELGRTRHPERLARSMICLRARGVISLPSAPIGIWRRP